MKKHTIVLGIHDGHNAGAALVQDGRVVAAISEERLVNEKNYSGTPVNAIREVFRIAGIPPAELDLIAVAGLIRTHAPLKERPLHVVAYERFASVFSSHLVNKLLVDSLHRRRLMEELHDLFKELGIDRKSCFFIEHHTAHAACAYYQRPWEDRTLVLTLDGAGDGLCSTVSVGEKFGLARVASTTAYNSPGNVFYSEITGYLGLKRWEHEYKVMGMAPYGVPDYCLNQIRSIVRINPKRPLEFENTIGAYGFHVQPRISKLLSEQRFDNISAATQQYFEELVTAWVRNAIDRTGVSKIACSGGMFLNVKANKLLREMEGVEATFFHPAASDEGICIGAALEGYYRFCEREGLKPQREPLGSIYYGKEYSDTEIEAALKKTGWAKKAVRIGDIDAEIGQRVAGGAILARFSGRDEFGPRGLGNRSILADPRNLKVIRKINFAIKHRDFWMPFAPSILEARMGDYLVDARPAPYMIEAFDTRPLASEIVAGLHPKDMTARPQTVRWNDGYRKVLESFEEFTGVGGVLNTSFNLHGFPVVGTPEVALDTLEKSGLDGLALGHWLVLK